MCCDGCDKLTLLLTHYHYALHHFGYGICLLEFPFFLPLFTFNVKLYYYYINDVFTCLLYLNKFRNSILNLFTKDSVGTHRKLPKCSQNKSFVNKLKHSVCQRLPLLSFPDLLSYILVISTTECTKQVLSTQLHTNVL